jgi:hypothetical protein
MLHANGEPTHEVPPQPDENQSVERRKSREINVLAATIDEC